MPSGYQNRLSNTYWTSAELSWDGTKWTGSIATDLTLTPTGSMDMNFAELRILLKMIGVLGVGPRLITFYDNTILQQVFVTAAKANQFLTLRLNGVIGDHSEIRLVFDASTNVEITQIEAGYVGFH